MTSSLRRQLTLFVEEADAQAMEAIRSKYNSLQSALINCHVTLCREDEIAAWDTVLENLVHLKQPAISIEFGQVIRFDYGKGVLLPATGDNAAFHHLRQVVLKGVNDHPRRHEPHITLMHPRNATCTDANFETIAKVNLPSRLTFSTISLIEQVNGGQWKSLDTYHLWR